MIRRAAPVVVATGLVALLLANVRARPPAIPVSKPHPQPVRRVSCKPAQGPARAATETRTTPFSVISVRATLRGRRLACVETVDLTGENARTNAINARAEPILREEALKAGGADIDVVTGATYTSESYKEALQAAIDRARG